MIHTYILTETYFMGCSPQIVYFLYCPNCNANVLKFNSSIHFQSLCAFQKKVHGTGRAKQKLTLFDVTFIKKK